MSLRSQRRLAAEILKVGVNRVWIDPDRIEEVESAITREEIRKLIHEGAIRALKKKGISRARARIIHEKKKKGLRRGPGSRSGTRKARLPRKRMWMMRIRALRRRLRELKSRRLIAEGAYRRLYIMAKSGAFKSIAEMERYIDAHNLWRRR
ncbi:50S ribosomal protein L19e [Candidatus Bathyarchaeota archaeon]|nr:MAG: 50S ribosomal protein L19e [Candidatus Bathyarchaeota archaeon]